jgi:hypothetical protein
MTLEIRDDRLPEAWVIGKSPIPMTSLTVEESLIKTSGDRSIFFCFLGTSCLGVAFRLGVVSEEIYFSAHDGLALFEWSWSSPVMSVYVF